ncbi:MAG: c-type cytochrome domain-containing protein [Flavobacteriaceae bacterium]
MASNPKNGWADYAIFGLSVFLIFCLIFESHIALPTLVAWLGRWHPMVLHFPIVLLLIAIFLGFTGKQIPRVLLTTAVLSALITAISGFFLATGSGTRGNLLFWHQWLGAATALIAALWYYAEGRGMARSSYAKSLPMGLAVLIGFTGHYGGMVTHGEEYLAFPTNSTDHVMPENPLIYTDVVAQILDNHCVKCHNQNKLKGELLMTNMAGLLKGGESGKTLIPGNYEESELIVRMHLPLEDEKHMPPEGETPLSQNQIKILERWIALGASDTLKLSHLDNNEPLVAHLNSLIKPDPSEKWKLLPAVADSTISRLSSDYLTIRRLAGGANALSINMYMPPAYDPSLITGLKPLAKNIIEMDVSGLPLGQEEMNLIASCQNLEWLEVDRTPITDVEADTLKSLSNLRILKIYDTKIGNKSIPVLKKIQSLRQVYLWNTSISPDVLNTLKKENPTLFVDTGIDQELQTLFTAKDSIPKI